MKKLVLSLAALLLVAPLAVAQAQEVDLQTYLDLLQRDVRNERAQLVGEAMMLDANQSAPFWEIYGEFEKAAEAGADARSELIQRYAESYATMDDATANELAETLLAIDSGQLELKRDYYERVRAELGATKAARFLQVNNQIDALVRLQIASQIPLIEVAQ